MPDIAWRPLALDDLTLLSGWLSEPEVARWWREPSDLPTLQAKYAPRVLERDRTEVHVVLVDGEPVGIVQRYRFADNPDWEAAVAAAWPGAADLHAAGIDYLIGPADVRGRGVGTALLRSYAERVLADWAEVDAVVVTVLQDNVASWRALEKAGFSREHAGEIESDDPADDGPQYVLVRRRLTP